MSGDYLSLERVRALIEQWRQNVDTTFHVCADELEALVRTPREEDRRAFPVFQCEEWQCRHVFPDKRCCLLRIGHEGEHRP